MIYLIGGPPRVGKSTLARMLLDRDRIPGCSTDALVSMLQNAAPHHGVRHGTHPDKADLAQPFLIEFLRAVADGIGEEPEPSECYVVEGDIVTPAVVAAAAGFGLPVAAVFLGNTALTADDLRIAPHWLEGADDATYCRTAAWITERSAIVRDACVPTGQVYIEMGGGHTEGLERAYAAL
ncbi:hypothetical protein AB0I10_33945 [Streptomyces sp. NPDC050636]|uniref:hypothetical protein n=1 Tax=Streptomyces sp. NPDC050636 TaxID=3154510 RepID=UPI003439CFCE